MSPFSDIAILYWPTEQLHPFQAFNLLALSSCGEKSCTLLSLFVPIISLLAIVNSFKIE